MSTYIAKLRYTYKLHKNKKNHKLNIYTFVYIVRVFDQFMYLYYKYLHTCVRKEWFPTVPWFSFIVNHGWYWNWNHWIICNRKFVHDKNCLDPFITAWDRARRAQCVVTTDECGDSAGTRASNEPLARAFAWLTAATTAFTFKTLLRHFAEQMLTPR